MVCSQILNVCVFQTAKMWSVALLPLLLSAAVADFIGGRFLDGPIPQLCAQSKFSSFTPNIMVYNLSYQQNLKIIIYSYYVQSIDITCLSLFNILGEE